MSGTVGAGTALFPESSTVIGTQFALLAQSTGPPPGAAEAVAGIGILMVCVMAFFFIAITALSLSLFAFQIWMIVDCAQHEPKMHDNQTLIWILVIIFTGWIGAAIYYFVRRPQNRVPTAYGYGPAYGPGVGYPGPGYGKPPYNPNWPNQY